MSTGTGLARYAAVLASDRVRPVLAASTVARLQFGVESLAVLLFVREQTGSFGAAGAATAAITLAAGVLAPARGRMLDGADPRRALRRTALLHSAALVLLVALGAAGAVPAALTGAAALVGAARPPVLVAQRTLWTELLAERPGLLPAAYALDALVTEVVLIGGPVLVALAAALGSPAGALALDGAAVLGGTFWFTAVAPLRRARPPASARRASPLADPGVRTLVLGSLTLGLTFGSLDVALVAFGRTVAHSASFGGLLLTMISIGAAVGGVTLGGREHRTSAAHRVRALAALPCLVVAMAAVGSPAPMVAVALVAGIPIIPLSAALNEALTTVTVEGAFNEAYSWVVMAGVLASGAASGVAGGIVEARGWRADLLLTAAVSATMTLAFLLRGGTLRPAPSTAIHNHAELNPPRGRVSSHSHGGISSGMPRTVRDADGALDGDEMGEPRRSAGEAGRIGPKESVGGAHAVCASQHPLVTETVLDVLRGGGNAIDAGIAGALVQSTVQQEMTNHAGTVTCLYWEAATRRVHELNARGTIVPGLAPFRPVPRGRGLFAREIAPIGVIPGFMPALGQLHERFATKPWSELCQPAVRWAHEGHVVTSFEHLVLAQTVDFYLHSASGRAHFTPGGHLPQVGDRWPKPELARTLERLAAHGPTEFTEGDWARAFVARANELGWPIELHHMTDIPPRWGEGCRHEHRGHEIVQLSPPERTAVFCSLVLGILDELELARLGRPWESAEAMYLLGHALRRAHLECGHVNDPRLFSNPLEVLMSREYHAMLARVLRDSVPAVDLSRHVELAHGPGALAAAGGAPVRQPAGSCELSIVDAQGNWLQLMNTLQSGGIPGEVVGGVPMVGSHVLTSLTAELAGWFTGGGRMRSRLGNTLVLRDGAPVLALGSPGNVAYTAAQVLSNILDHRMDPYAADDAPHMLALADDYTLPVESRIAPEVVAGLARRGVLVDPLPRYDYVMGSFQMSWRDERGLLHAAVGPRMAGTAGALEP